MHPYIPHLLEDIEKAHRTASDVVQPARDMSFEEEMEALEDWDDHAFTFGYHCGLDPINFPPPEQLTTKDIKIVNRAFRKMMASWNISSDLPGQMPARVAYSFIVDSLNEKVPIVDNGFVGIDFCTGYAPDCKLKEYCNCLEFYNSLEDDDKDELTGDPDDLPF